MANILKLGIVGNGRIAKRFASEAKYVDGVLLQSIFGRNEEHIKSFCNDYGLINYYTNYEKFLDSVDAVYVATPHKTHYDFAKKAILAKKHVLCEKPMVLTKNEAEELYDLAEYNSVILQEAIKTAYAPGFSELINVAKSGIIGEIKDISATFTKLVLDKNLREYDKSAGGGCCTELGTYPLCPIVKLFGTDYKNLRFACFTDSETHVDYYTKINIEYKNSMATATVGIGVKKEGDMVIAGTLGYIYVPAPWWKTEYFEIRHENVSDVQKFYKKFEGDGLRYELSEFLCAINTHKNSCLFTKQESIFVAEIMEHFINYRDKITD